MSTNIESGASPGTRAASFHPDDDTIALGDYRSLSVPALISLVLGLAAPLCFVSPLLMLVPMVGAVLALVALRRITNSEGMLAGRWAALLGLALCVASMLAVFSYSQVIRTLRVRDAEKFGQEWIGLVQAGDSEHAFRLTNTGARPAPADPEPGAKPTNPYDGFLANPLVRDLQAMGKTGKVHAEGTAFFETRAKGNYVVEQQFSVLPAPASESAPASGHEPVRLALTLQRARLPGETNSRWLVVNYAAENSNAAADHDHSH